MEPMLSNLSAGIRNEPRDLQSRLYREIGISAVAAALQLSEMAGSDRSETRGKRERFLRRAA